ncbi:SAM-dependent methyltransferase [Streptomonospora litoralis]|uniref:S-adenosyl methyltransferase n=1 Tax=Streptomonospora litoralis TaxID=2498135 RepID=A0A4P6PYQ5_9ACTN|nr:SAM-dependent methyltransferase [Streptomonospora litoralis]QBI53368.1 S-adenosyl methyltransferase [Streptomonospora litoralis]
MPGFESPEFMKRAGDAYSPVVPEINTEKASIARVYSYYLGGKDHFEVDRDMANYAESVVPGVTDLAMGNRAFVQRSTRYLAAERGIDQFLDIGSGLPSDGNVHEVAHESNPRARVVYVDNDAIVLAHARALLADNNTTVVLCNDLTRPQEVLQEAENTGLIDLSRPLGLMLGGILHHLADDEDPDGIARLLREVLAPGSSLVVSHFCEPDPAELPEDARRAERLQTAFLERLKTGMWRTPDQIRAYFGDWPLVEPGLVALNKWRPLPPDAKSAGSYTMPPRNENIIVGGVAVKP